MKIADDTVARVRSLMTLANPVSEEEFSMSWTDELRQEEFRKILASDSGHAAWPSRGRRASHGRRWRLAGLGAVAAGFAAALFVAAGLPAARVQHPAHLGVFSPAAGSIGAVSGSGRPARVVLLSVARRVAREAPVTTGRYWHVSAAYGNFRLVGPAGDRYMILEQGLEKLWLPRHKSDSSAEVIQRLGTKLGSAADAGPWRRDGSPAMWNITSAEGVAGPQGFFDGDHAPVRAARGKPFVAFSEAPSSALSYKGRPLSDLPASPELLRTVLMQGYENPVSDGSTGSWLLQEAFQLLADPVSPAVRSAVYQLLAGLPGVQNLGTVRDVAGRAGSGVALISRQARCLISGTGWDSGTTGSPPPTSSCVVQQLLIVNPVTGMPIAQELSFVKPPAGSQWPAPGGMFSYEVLRNASWGMNPPPAP